MRMTLYLILTALLIALPSAITLIFLILISDDSQHITPLALSLLATLSLTLLAGRLLHKRIVKPLDHMIDRLYGRDNLGIVVQPRQRTNNPSTESTFEILQLERAIEFKQGQIQKECQTNAPSVNTDPLERDSESANVDKPDHAEIAAINAKGEFLADQVSHLSSIIKLIEPALGHFTQAYNQ